MKNHTKLTVIKKMPTKTKGKMAISYKNDSGSLTFHYDDRNEFKKALKSLKTRLSTENQRKIDEYFLTD